MTREFTIHSEVKISFIAFALWLCIWLPIIYGGKLIHFESRCNWTVLALIRSRLSNGFSKKKTQMKFALFRRKLVLLASRHSARAKKKHFVRLSRAHIYDIIFFFQSNRAAKKMPCIYLLTQNFVRKIESSTLILPKFERLIVRIFFSHSISANDLLCVNSVWHSR